MIDQATIGRIIETAEITDVISEFIHLKKRGVNFLGLCPFHNEKTPSFTVSPTKGIYKCFGCGKGGNAINFIMEHENLNYPEALRWLAKKYNIEIVEKEETREEKQLKDEQESMMILTAFGQKYFSDFLWNEEEGKAIGLSYFRERGLNDDTIKKFGLGYNPQGKNIFSNAAQKQGYQMEYLEKTGLTIKRDDWMRDRFEGRVIFPIYNLAGRTIAFGGRLLTDDPKAAKYVNSPESAIYHKSKALYGIYHAKRGIVKNDKCYLVEGYTDVLSLSQKGIENVVASSGTALTQEQIRLIKRFTSNITIIYDGDEAGIKASLRGIDLILEQGMNVKVLLLPQGEDPDSFSKSHDSDSLLEFISRDETDFIRFKTTLLLKSTENDPVARARLVSDVIRSVAVIPDTITRTVYIRECSKLLNVGEEILYNEVRKNRRKLFDKGIQQGIKQKDTVIHKQITQIVIEDKEELTIEEKEILRFLIKYCKYPLFEVDDEDKKDQKIIHAGEYIIEEIESDELVPEKHEFVQVFNDIKELNHHSDFDPVKHFVYHPDEKISKLASDLLSEKFVESKRWKKAGAFTEKEEDILDLLIPKIINEYKLKKIRGLLSDLENEIQNASRENDYDRIFEAQATYMNLKNVEKDLSEKLGSRTFI